MNAHPKLICQSEFLFSTYRDKEASNRLKTEGIKQQKKIEDKIYIFKESDVVS